MGSWMAGPSSPRPAAVDLSLRWLLLSTFYNDSLNADTIDFLHEKSEI